MSGGVIAWATPGYEINTNGNALRWGTLYNFRFHAASPPQLVEATIGLFRPGFPDSVRTQTLGPSAPPGEACVPTDDGTGCAAYPCSAALEEICMSTVLHLSPDGAMRVVACECLDWLTCRVELDDGLLLSSGAPDSPHRAHPAGWHDDSGFGG